MYLLGQRHFFRLAGEALVGEHSIVGNLALAADVLVAEQLNGSPDAVLRVLADLASVLVGALVQRVVEDGAVFRVEGLTE